jgi:UDP-N-acetylmuramoylalanine--D-glutamate ligase
LGGDGLDFSGKRILVVGMARSGMAAIKALDKRGAQISACDEKEARTLVPVLDELEKQGIKYYAGRYPEVKRQVFDLLVVSPGVPLETAPIRQAREQGIPVIGEVELAYILKPKGVEFLAISGTNGKTTTTSLLHYILAQAGRNSLAGGNIGIPLTTLLDSISEGTIVVELSSFQLESSSSFRPYICGLLNITPDHLNRHKNMERYIEAKAKIFAQQKPGDYAVFNYEDSILREMARSCPAQTFFFSSERELMEGAFINNGVITIKRAGIIQEIARIDEVSLRGKHNLENILAATMMASLAGVSPEDIRQALASFPGVRHRMEELGLYDDVLYVNDSKATNPEAVMKALDSFNQPIILIAGGRNKGSSFSQLAGLIKQKVRELVLLGEAREEIKAAVIDAGFRNIHEVEDLQAAVIKARELARKGEVVLLSPACASWDMFASYEQRGDLFCEIINSISK